MSAYKASGSADTAVPPPVAAPAAVTPSKSKKGRCDLKTLRKIIKNNKATASSQVLDKVLAEYNSEKGESNAKDWLVGKIRKDNMSNWLGSHVTGDQANALKGL